MSNFSFSHNVFKRLVSQRRQKVSLCGNGLMRSIHLCSFKMIPEILFVLCSGQRCGLRTDRRTDGQTNQQTDKCKATYPLFFEGVHNNAFDLDMFKNLSFELIQVTYTISCFSPKVISVALRFKTIKRLDFMLLLILFQPDNLNVILTGIPAHEGMTFLAYANSVALNQKIISLIHHAL